MVWDLLEGLNIEKQTSWYSMVFGDETNTPKSFIVKLVSLVDDFGKTSGVFFLYGLWCGFFITFGPILEQFWGHCWCYVRFVWEICLISAGGCLDIFCCGICYGRVFACVCEAVPQRSVVSFPSSCLDVLFFTNNGTLGYERQYSDVQLDLQGLDLPEGFCSRRLLSGGVPGLVFGPLSARFWSNVGVIVEIMLESFLKYFRFACFLWYFCKFCQMILHRPK